MRVAINFVGMGVDFLPVEPKYTSPKCCALLLLLAVAPRIL